MLLKSKKESSTIEFQHRNYFSLDNQRCASNAFDHLYLRESLELNRELVANRDVRVRWSHIWLFPNWEKKKIFHSFYRSNQILWATIDIDLNVELVSKDTRPMKDDDQEPFEFSKKKIFQLQDNVKMNVFSSKLRFLLRVVHLHEVYSSSVLWIIIIYSCSINIRFSWLVS